MASSNKSSRHNHIRARLKETHIENATEAVSTLMTPKQFKSYLSNIKICVNSLDDDEMEFDLIGVDPVIANTLRRLLVAEIPGMAMDHIFIYQNTSVIPDEMLAHRIGLIPIRANVNDFTHRQPVIDGVAPSPLDGTDEDTLEFTLHFKASRKTPTHQETSPQKGKGRGKTSSEQREESQLVLSGDIKWRARGEQADRFPRGFKPALDDIVIAKMVPGQEIECVMHCVKGVGKDHAKFSPVATAFYRFMPEIVLLEEIVDDLADRLQECFPQGVIDIRKEKGGRRVARVEDVRRDNGSGNVLLDDELKDKVELNKIKNHIIFTVESVGMMPAKDLIPVALKTMINKCRGLLDELEK